MEFQLSCFKSSEMMLWKCCTQYVSKFGKLSSGHRTGKGQFSFQSVKRQCQRIFKLPHNCNHLTHWQSNAQNSVSQASINMWTMIFQIFKLVLEGNSYPPQYSGPENSMNFTVHGVSKSWIRLRIWNSSTRIPSPPLALFIVMLPKAHLTWHSSMSGSRWVITSLWLSGSWRSFCPVLCILATSS